MNKEYVDNDVFRFRISLKSELELDDITIYTKPFPDFPVGEYKSDEQVQNFYDEQENLAFDDEYINDYASLPLFYKTYIHNLVTLMVQSINQVDIFPLYYQVYQNGGWDDYIFMKEEEFNKNFKLIE